MLRYIECGSNALSEPERYAAEGRWITIGAEGREGGGTHVAIDGQGKILAGPKGMEGQNVSDLGKSQAGDKAQSGIDKSDSPSAIKEAENKSETPVDTRSNPAHNAGSDGATEPAESGQMRARKMNATLPYVDPKDPELRGEFWNQERWDEVMKKRAAFVAQAAKPAILPKDAEEHDWEDFRDALAAYATGDEDAPSHMAGRSGATWGGSLNVYGASPSRLFDVYVGERKRERRTLADDHWRENSYPIVAYKGDTPLKPKTKGGDRVAKDAVKDWDALTGNRVLVTHSAKVTAPEDRGNDELSFASNYRVTLKKIGAELPEGTVKAKRQIRTEEGLQIQYAVQPRSKAKEAEYQRPAKRAAVVAKVRQVANHLTTRANLDGLDKLWGDGREELYAGGGRLVFRQYEYDGGWHEWEAADKSAEAEARKLA